jgi:hypothetical protein
LELRAAPNLRLVEHSPRPKPPAGAHDLDALRKAATEFSQASLGTRVRGIVELSRVLRRARRHDLRKHADAVAGTDSEKLAVHHETGLAIRGAPQGASTNGPNLYPQLTPLADRNRSIRTGRQCRQAAWRLESNPFDARGLTACICVSPDLARMK